MAPPNVLVLSLPYSIDPKKYVRVSSASRSACSHFLWRNQHRTIIYPSPTIAVISSPISSAEPLPRIKDHPLYILIEERQNMMQPILELNTDSSDILLEIFESSHSALFDLHFIYDVCPLDFLKYFHEFLLFQKDIFFDDKSVLPLRKQPSATVPGYTIGYTGIIEHCNMAKSKLTRSTYDQPADRVSRTVYTYNWRVYYGRNTRPSDSFWNGR